MSYPGQIPSGNALGNSAATTMPSAPTPGVIFDSGGMFYKAANALFPEYAIKTFTTATSTNASPTITVTSPTGIAQYDLIGAAYVPFGTYVVNIVGSVVTMSANATATNVTPVVTTFGQDRFQAQNSLLTNVLAAQVGNFGSAARGHSTWLAQFSGALDLNWSSVFSISPIGQTGVTAATRSSDNFAPASNTIANIIYVVADNSAFEIFTWGTYAESFLPTGAIETSHIQYEGSVVSQWTVVDDETPYNINPTVAVRNMRLDNGKGLPCDVVTVALDIVNNGGTYRSGIVFHETAFDYSDPRDYASAIAMAAKQSLDWYTTVGSIPSWSIWADDGSPTTFRMRNVNDALDFLTIDANTGILVLGETDVQTNMRGPLKLKSYTTATLPAATAGLEGAIAYVTDATAPTWNGAYVGGGAVKCLVMCDNAAWLTR